MFIDEVQKEYENGYTDIEEAKLTNDNDSTVALIEYALGLALCHRQIRDRFQDENEQYLHHRRHLLACTRVACLYSHCTMK